MEKEEGDEVMLTFGAVECRSRDGYKEELKAGAGNKKGPGPQAGYVLQCSFSAFDPSVQRSIASGCDAQWGLCWWCIPFGEL